MICEIDNKGTKEIKIGNKIFSKKNEIRANLMNTKAFREEQLKLVQEQLMHLKTDPNKIPAEKQTSNTRKLDKEEENINFEIVNEVKRRRMETARDKSEETLNSETKEGNSLDKDKEEKVTAEPMEIQDVELKEEQGFKRRGKNFSSNSSEEDNVLNKTFSDPEITTSSRKRKFKRKIEKERPSFRTEKNSQITVRTATPTPRMKDKIAQESFHTDSEQEKEFEMGINYDQPKKDDEKKKDNSTKNMKGNKTPPEPDSEKTDLTQITQTKKKISFAAKPISKPKSKPEVTPNKNIQTNKIPVQNEENGKAPRPPKSAKSNPTVTDEHPPKEPTVKINKEQSSEKLKIFFNKMEDTIETMLKENCGIFIKNIEKIMTAKFNDFLEETFESNQITQYKEMR
nr:PREDICTED: uncharacterized protein F59B10.2-like [Bemisia tabaci]